MASMTDETKPMSETDRQSLLASDRLIFMRVLEKFANEVSGAVASLKVDVEEIQRQIGIRNQALVDNGSIPQEEVTDEAPALEESED